MKDRSALLALAIGVILSTASVSQLPEERRRELALSIAGMIGLSRQGTQHWAQRSLQWGGAAEYKRITEIELAIGTQLAKESPDRAALSRLLADYADESAALARQDKERLIDTAFELSANDRRTLGKFVVRGAREELAKAPPAMPRLP